MTPDPKPSARVRNPAVLAKFAVEHRECALAGLTPPASVIGDDCVAWLSTHHVHKHPRDDVEANLVRLCGDGTRGHHGLIEAHDHETCRALAAYLTENRSDTMEYLSRKLGGDVAVREWLNRRLHARL